MTCIPDDIMLTPAPRSVSLPKRYFSKLFSNGLSALAGFISVTIVPRALGPAAFGDFTFLKNSFRSVITFFDLTAEQAFFNRVSKRKDVQKITSFYALFSLGMGAVIITALMLLHAAHRLDLFWPGQRPGFVFAGAALGLLLAYTTRLTTLADGTEITILVELRRCVWIVLVNAALIALYFLRHLTLGTYFALQICSYLMLLGIIITTVIQKGIYRLPVTHLTGKETADLWGYFYRYSHPLFVATLVTFLYTFFDTWFLQKVGGAIEQGLYGIAYNLGAICFLITGSVTPLFMQSFGKAHGEEDLERMKSLFGRMKLFYCIAAFFSVFFFFRTTEMISLFAGDKYASAHIPLMIMILYPIHQTFGQLNGGLILMMEKTRIHRNVGILTALIGMTATYILLAPAGYVIPGLGLKSTGLALKMVLVQVISVNIMLAISCRILGLSYFRSILDQVLPLAVLFLASGSTYLLESVWSPHTTATGPIILRFACSGLLYLCLALGAFFLFPDLTGMPRTEMQRYVQSGIRRITRLFTRPA